VVIRQVATARSKIRAAAKILNEKIVAQERLKASEVTAKKSKESSDEKLFQVVDMSSSIPKVTVCHNNLTFMQDALKEQQDENKRENFALKKDLIIAAKKKLW
jgi:hypothetical protein